MHSRQPKQERSSWKTFGAVENSKERSNNHGGRQVASGTTGEILRDTHTASLEQAFSYLTGVKDVGAIASELLSALDRV